MLSKCESHSLCSALCVGTKKERDVYLHATTRNLSGDAKETREDDKKKEEVVGGPGDKGPPKPTPPPPIQMRFEEVRRRGWRDGQNVPPPPRRYASLFTYQKATEWEPF